MVLSRAKSKMVRLRDHRRRFTLARRSFTSGSAEALPPVDSMASMLDPFEVLDVANGVLQAAVVWFDAAVLQEPPTRHSLELGATLAGTAFEIEHRYNNSFQSFMPGHLVSDGKGGYVVHDLFGRMLGPNAEVTDDVATATMPLSSLLEEWGDDEYHIAPRLERWRQHKQLAPLLAPAAVQTQWTSENVRDHPSFADFVAFMRGEEGDPSWEFDGEQEEIEAWADWLAPAAPVAPAAAPPLPPLPFRRLLTYYQLPLLPLPLPMFVPPHHARITCHLLKPPHQLPLTQLSMPPPAHQRRVHSS